MIKGADNTYCKEKKNYIINYSADWQLLKQYKVPKWWKNMKLGICFHRRPCSIPAHKTKWCSHWMFKDGKLLIRSLSSSNSYLKDRIKKISMLGVKENLKYKQTSYGLENNFPQ